MACRAERLEQQARLERLPAESPATTSQGPGAVRAVVRALATSSGDPARRRGFPQALEAVKAILEGNRTITPEDLLDRTRNSPEDRVVEVLVGKAYQLVDVVLIVVASASLDARGEPVSNQLDYEKPDRAGHGPVDSHNGFTIPRSGDTDLHIETTMLVSTRGWCLTRRPRRTIPVLTHQPPTAPDIIFRHATRCRRHV
jgi:hypothetical protein